MYINSFVASEADNKDCLNIFIRVLYYLACWDNINAKVLKRVVQKKKEGNFLRSINNVIMSFVITEVANGGCLSIFIRVLYYLLC